MAKRIYGKWSVNDMEKAITEYKSGIITFNKCCLKYNIPKPTFKRHLDGKVKRYETEKEQAEENKKNKENEGKKKS